MAHILPRGKKKIYQLIDGRIRFSLGTSVKRFAQLQLEKYLKGTLKISDGITVQSFYNDWIETQRNEKGVKPRRVKDYEGHFRIILPEIGSTLLADVDFGRLTKLKNKLGQTRHPKTVRNIIDGSFRAMWRAALKSKLVTDNPFELLEWHRGARPAPDPFSVAERDRIIAHFLANDPFYYPYVFVQFHTGMRPSESAALTWADVDLEAGTATITKSLDMGDEGDTKTFKSRRIIPISEAVVMVFSIAPKWHDVFVFVNKHGRRLTKKWAEHYWGKTLKHLGLRHRKFYATRHTFITEAIKAGDDAVVVANYVGTSVKMIQEDYLGRVVPPSLAATKMPQPPKNLFRNVVAGPGFECGHLLPGYTELRRITRDEKSDLGRKPKNP